MFGLLEIFFVTCAFSFFAGVYYQDLKRKQAISIIILVGLVVAAPLINSEWSRMTNLLLDEENSHYGLPKEWEGTQVICFHFPENLIPEELENGRHHFNSEGVKVFVDTSWNESGACIGGFSNYSNGFTFMLEATNITGELLNVEYSESSFGPYITLIGGIDPCDAFVCTSSSGAYWSLYHNGELSMVGIGDIVLFEDSVIVWQVATW